MVNDGVSCFCYLPRSATPKWHLYSGLEPLICMQMRKLQWRSPIEFSFTFQKAATRMVDSTLIDGLSKCAEFRSASFSSLKIFDLFERFWSLLVWFFRPSQLANWFVGCQLVIQRWLKPGRFWCCGKNILKHRFTLGLGLFVEFDMKRF